jgi:hypothetical protein
MILLDRGTVSKRADRTREDTDVEVFQMCRIRFVSVLRNISNCWRVIYEMTGLHS